MFLKKICLVIGFGLSVFMLVACQQPESVRKVASTEGTDHEVHWSYEGDGSPEHWAALKEDYKTCGTGTEQSPIDLTSETLADLSNVAFHYEESEVKILNNGHAIQINYDTGSSIEVNGETYSLLQVHFHAPSEHAVDGVLYPAEMHLVHQNAKKELAVVGVFITEGAENAAFAPIWENLPGEETKETATGMMINATELLPSNQAVFRYGGSLTTPPCSENVLWSVVETPVEMSAQQIEAYTDIFEGTNRPVQPLNERDLQLDNTP